MVGPQSYDPVNPTHSRTDNLKGGQSIGNSKRSGVISSLNVPGPGQYNLTGIQEKPKFHMG